MKNNFILGDVSAIKEKGIESLLDNYYWPVSDSEFREFVKYTHYEYLKIVHSIDDDDIRNIAIVELSFIAKLQQILHYNYVKKYSHDNNLELINSKLSEEFYNPNWDLISKHYVSLSPLLSKTKGLVKRTVKNILFNRHISTRRYIKNLIFGSNVIGIGSNDILKKEFIIKKNYFCDHVNATDLYSSKIISNKQLKDISIRIDNEIITPYIYKLETAKNKFVEGIDITTIKEAWKSRFTDAARIYLNIISKGKSPCLLVTELAKPIHKLVTVAYQKLGSDVYCFHHGHDTAVTVHSVGHDITSLHCLKYVVPSCGISNKYQKVYPHLSTKYYSSESNWYKLQLKKYICKTNKKIKKIMLVGFPLNPVRYVDGESCFFYSRIDLEYRLITFLKKNGYSAIYKAHPDRLSEATGLYEGVVDEIISSPFETIINSTDCFLFTHSSSTTFGYALLTNKPIFLIDINSSNVELDSYNLLRKRVDMIPSYTVKSTRIFFDKDIMLKKMRRSPVGVQDNSYLEKMFLHNTINIK